MSRIFIEQNCRIAEVELVVFIESTGVESCGFCSASMLRPRWKREEGQSGGGETILCGRINL